MEDAEEFSDNEDSEWEKPAPKVRNRNIVDEGNQWTHFEDGSLTEAM